MRTNHLPFPQDGSGIPAAAASMPPGVSVPGDGRLQVTRDARRSRLVLAGDIDLTAHAALTAALALAADGAGQVHVDLAGVTFCDVAGLRIILDGGDGQQPVTVRVTVHNLPPHLEKLLRLLNRDVAPELAADAAGQARTSTGHPDQAARPRNGRRARTLISTLKRAGHAACSHGRYADA